MNDKLKEVFGVLFCVVILIAIGYYTGFLNESTVNNFQKIINDVSSDISSIDKNLNLGSSGSSKGRENKNNSRIKNYRANNIQDSVLEGAQLSGFWRNIFGSNRKVIFYVYDERGADKKYSLEFHNKISNTYNTAKLSRYYDFEPSGLAYFKNYNVGIVGSTKVCNSIEECKQQRNLATKRASMQMFLDRCSKAFCVIYPKKKEFMMLRHQDETEAIKMLNALKNW